jgi:hypothetical protein
LEAHLALPYQLLLVLACSPVPLLVDLVTLVVLALPIPFPQAALEWWEPLVVVLVVLPLEIQPE